MSDNQVNAHSILLKKIWLERAEVFCNRRKKEHIDNLPHLNATQNHISSYVWGMEGKRIKSYVDYPAGWWQHFKQAVFPRWLQKLSPVRNTRLEASCQQYLAVCPHLGTSDKECIDWICMQEARSLDGY